MDYFHQWTPETDRQLVNSLQEAASEHGIVNVSFTKGLRKIDWSKIRVASFSSDACKKRWSHIQALMRTQRSLAELTSACEHEILNCESSSMRYLQLYHADQVPKKPSGAFFTFCRDNRNVVKRKHPNISEPQITSKLAAKYRKLAPSEKEEYLEKSRREFDAYQSVLSNIRSHFPDSLATPKKTRKKPQLPANLSNGISRNTATLTTDINISPKKQAAKRPATKSGGPTNKRRNVKQEPEMSQSEQNINSQQPERNMIVAETLSSDVDDDATQVFLVQNVPVAERPQKPPSLFAIFSEKQQKKLARKFPDDSQQEHRSRIEFKWKNLNLSKRAKLSRKRSRLMEVYNAELENVKKLYGFKTPSSGKKRSMSGREITPKIRK